jgi:hypothetical protein
MKIFGICCVRDENDIIRDTLEAALAWNDKIFVFDNASTDGTWETVSEMARQHSKIVIVGHDDRTFTEELRSEIFEDHRNVASPGDWWCRLDADEIYIDNPLQFLASVPALYGFVWSATFNFYFTDVDAQNYERNPSEWLSRPVPERIRHYQNNWSEPRFVRHRKNLRWKGEMWPPNRGLSSPRRIRLKHYQYRSPEQIARRIGIRRTLLTIFPHEAKRELCVPKDAARSDWSENWMKTAALEEVTWRDRVRPASDCDVDAGDGLFVTREGLMPKLPSPTFDIVRAIAQETTLGQAVVRPIAKWRQNLIRPTGFKIS